MSTLTHISEGSDKVGRYERTFHGTEIQTGEVNFLKTIQIPSEKPKVDPEFLHFSSSILSMKAVAY
jgi:hypothetical protein